MHLSNVVANFFVVVILISSRY